MGNGYNADLMKARAAMIHSPRTTKHPGSKPGRIPTDWCRGKGNTFKAVTRSYRRRPGWKKALVKAQEAAQQQALAEQAIATARAKDKQLRDEMREQAANPPWKASE